MNQSKRVLQLPSKQSILSCSTTQPQHGTSISYLIDLDIAGIPVKFPYVAYEEQKIYMESVIKACEESKNALLESPTGTGKTLSLLCSSLGWLNTQRENPKYIRDSAPRIIYLSRTHSQLIQVVRELKKTAYRPITVVLGSREQMCINDDARKAKGMKLDIACKQLRNMKKCPYAQNKKEKLPLLDRELMDIEDLKKFGKENGICPFFATRGAMGNSELLLLPYNYLLDPKIRTMYSDLDFKNSVVIFDEAHNVSKVSEDVNSFEISIDKLGKCLEEVKRVKDMTNSGEAKRDPDIKHLLSAIKPSEFLWVSQPIASFIKYLNDFPEPGRDGFIMEGRKLFDIFLDGTTTKSENDIRGFIETDKVVKYESGITLSNCMGYMSSVNKFVEVLVVKENGSFLLDWNRVIETVYYYMANSKKEFDATSIASIDDFKVVIATEEKLEYKKEEEKIGTRELKVLCFNPAIGIVKLLQGNPRAIVLTSGTLSPMDTLQKELRIPFPIKMENKHIIDLSQVFFNVIDSTDNGHSFNFNYQNRNDERQLQALGEFIKEVSIKTPGGVLVFFSSYAVLNMCLRKWKDTITKDLIESHGIRTFKEEKSTEENTRMLMNFRHQISKKKAAVLYSVCRGKISEGLDFSDRAARAVIVVGIPFPMQTDKRVILKKEYLDKRVSILKINGTTWYKQEGLRAVNQAIGRVIRHINDYGAIILVDRRYTEENLRSMLSKWLREIQLKGMNTSACIERLTPFFKKQETLRPAVEEENSIEEEKIEVKSYTVRNPTTKKRERESKDMSILSFMKSTKKIKDNKAEASNTVKTGMLTFEEFRLKALKERTKEKLPTLIKNELGEEGYDKLYNIFINYKLNFDIEDFANNSIKALEQIIGTSSIDTIAKLALQLKDLLRQEDTEIYVRSIRRILKLT